MREEAVVVLRLDTGDLPAKSQQAAQSLAQIGVKGEISARQTAAAMRMLPAQLTDVATQLAGGQNPLLILLQQGGQVKDSFGGIGPAIRGIGAAITPLALGVGAVATGAGLAALAFSQGEREGLAFKSAILLTGNAAGTTAGQLAGMANRIDAVNGTQAQAAAALAQLVATGNVGRAQLERGAMAALELQRNLGVSVESTVKALSDLGRDPLQASIKLNEQYRFLTKNTYEQIRALELQGRTAEAASIAQEEFSKVGIKRAKEMAGNLGALERGWRGITDAARDSWDAMLGVGREATVEAQLADVQKRLAAPFRRVGDPSQAEARRESLRQREAELQEMLLIQRRAGDRQAKDAADLAAKIARDEEAKRAKLRKGPGYREPMGPPTFDEMWPAANVGAITAAREVNRLARVEELASYDGINKAVSAAQAAREEAARAQLRVQEEFLQDMRDANTRFGIEQIQDEQQRGLALIEMDRQIAARRLEVKGLTPGAREEALRLNDARSKYEIEKFTQKTGAGTYEDVRDALSAAFRDSNNPAKAFASALGSAIFQRVSAGMADALATAAVGKGGNGGLLGQALDFLGSFNGGYSVDTGGIGINGTGTSLPTAGGLATGTNYVPRNMVVKVHTGEAIVPRQYNPAAGGRAAGGSTVYLAQNLSVPPGMSPAALAMMFEQHGKSIKAALLESLARPGRPANNAVLSGLQ